MNIKVIDSPELYHTYLNKVQKLISSSPPAGTKESDELELLTLLLEKYDEENFKIQNPDPVDAIIFRMSQKNLKQTDLVKYFGSKSRVSEVLSRKRPLTIQMIRDVSTGLNIPVEILISESQKVNESNHDLYWNNFPIKEIAKKGWLEDLISNKKDELISSFEKFFSTSEIDFQSASFKKRFYGSESNSNSEYAIYAWLARVQNLASKEKTSLPDFDQTVVNEEFIKNLVHLSWLEAGPRLAVEYLNKAGISVIFEGHLKGTYLDGAAFKDKDGRPIIALTLRYDRLDNFWFTLVHELVHIWKHIKSDEKFIDDLDGDSEDEKESEANRITRDAFIPRSIWRRSEAYLNPSKENIYKLSRELKISPSIIAGRLRKEKGNYSLHTDLLGQGQVRNLLTSNSD